MKKNQVIKLTKESIAKGFRDLPIEQIEYKHISGKHTEEMNKAVLVYIKLGESIKVLKKSTREYGDCDGG